MSSKIFSVLSIAGLFEDFSSLIVAAWLQAWNLDFSILIVFAGLVEEGPLLAMRWAIDWSIVYWSVWWLLLLVSS